MAKCIVSRPKGDTTLNGVEYLLNDDGSLMEFENKAAAEEFIEKEFHAPEIVRYLDLEKHRAGVDEDIL